MLAPDTVLQGRYRILKTLGGGGMGAVYLAQDRRQADRQVAVKEMTPDTNASPAEQAQAQQLFQQEFSMLALLDHPNLPKVYDYFSESGKHYIVMDYIDGKTLEDILNDRPDFLPESQMIDWAAQLCDVLTYLHNRQPPVIFRDLKPHNIMVDRSGTIKLIDFGIARFFKPSQQKDTLRMGTAGYAPPEQYAGKGQTDARSDVYSMGATLHHLLTRRDPTDYPPFSFDTAPPRSLNPAISPHVEAAITKALAYDRTQRFQSASEMKQALLSPTPRRGFVKRVMPFLLIAVVVLSAGVVLTMARRSATSLTPTPTVGLVVVLATDTATPPLTTAPAPTLTLAAPTTVVSVTVVATPTTSAGVPLVATNPVQLTEPPTPVPVMRTPTATPTPTSSPYVTEIPLPPAAPTSTLIPRLLAASILLGPADGAQFQGNDATITLQWTPVEGLGPDNYYVVHITHRLGVDTQWTKETTLQPPAYLYDLGKDDRRYEWYVVVKRLTGQRPDGVKEGPEIGEPGETRTFIWHRSEPVPVVPTRIVSPTRER